MKSFIALLLVTAGVTAELNLQDVEGAVRRRAGHECDEHTTCETCAGDDDCHYNLRVGRCVDKSGRNSGEKWAKEAGDCPEKPPRFALAFGATCGEGYEPLTSRWEDCAQAARILGFKGDAVSHVQYNKRWGTTRPQGCFRNGNGQFHFNDGAGGNFKGRDRILCVLEGEGPVNEKRQAESSVESDGTEGGPVYEQSGPEVNAPAVPPLERKSNGGMVMHKFESNPANITTDFGEHAYKYYTKEEGWTNTPPVGRLICGQDDRHHVLGTTNKPWRWIVKMETTFANGQKSGCTGFFISKRSLMTNAHCVFLKERGGWVKHVKVCPGRDGDHSPYGCQWTTYVWVPWKWYDAAWDRTPHEYDYATMALGDNSMWNKGVGYFGFTTDLSSIVGVNVAGYPGDKGHYRLHWDYSSYEVRGPNLYYMADTTGGMSGGPLWAYLPDTQERYIVGVHAYGECPNSGPRVNDELFDWMWSFRTQYN